MFTKAFAWWEKFSVKCVLLIGLLIGVLLAYWAGRYTNAIAADYSDGRPFESNDFFLGNILAFIVWSFICMLIWRAVERIDKSKQDIWLHRIVVVLCGLLTIALIVWINISHYRPEADQWCVYAAAMEMAAGDYSWMEIGQYMFIYPYQLDLSYVLQVLFKIFQTEDFAVFQYINIIGAVTAVYFGYRIVKEITDEVVVQICYIMFAFSFLPLFLYTGYVYGDALSIGAANIGIWAIIKWCQCHKIRYALLAVWNIMLGCLIRKAFNIILIAIVIGLVYHILKEKCWKTLVLLCLCVAVPVGASQLIKLHYEDLSGYEVSKGLPVAYRLSSAMQESDSGMAGAYNHKMFLEYESVAGYDYELFSLYHINMIRGRLRDFAGHPPSIPHFYRRKLMEQWNEHSFCSYISMSKVDEPMGDLEWTLFYGDVKRITDWYLEYYLFILYLGVAISAVVLWKSRKEVYLLIPLIAFIGGFLFSIIWETVSRYALPYIVLIQIVAAVGIGLMLKKVWEIGGNLRLKKFGK